MRNVLTTLILCVALCRLTGSETPNQPIAHSTLSDPHSVIEANLPAGALSTNHTMLVSWQGTATRQTALDLTLLDGDGRWYHYQRPPVVAKGQTTGSFTLTLNPGQWSASKGPLDDQRLQAVTALRVKGADLSFHDLQVSLSAKPSSPEPEIWAIQPLDAGIGHGSQWASWRFRLLGPSHGRWLEVRTPQGQRIPCFFHDAATGPGWWEARLRPEEASASHLTLAIRQPLGEDLWSTTVELGPSHRRDDQSDGEAPPWPWVHSPAFRDLHTVAHRARQFSSADSLPPALAPFLRWRADWRDFHGPWVSSKGMARAFDHLLLNEVISDIDLLPAALGSEQGMFRFALSPWHHHQGGPWHHPQDIWRATGAHLALLDHAREILARARVHNGLQRWRTSLQIASNGLHETNYQLHLLHIAVTDMVLRYDGRPLHLLHQGLIPFAHQVPSTSWDQRQLPLSITIDANGLGKSHFVYDDSLFDISRQRLMVEFQGHAGATLFAWISDDRHHYYRQRLAYLRSDGQRHTVDIDWLDAQAWTAVGHEQPWHPGLKRRIRRIGLTVASDPLTDTQRAKGGQQLIVYRALDLKQPRRQQPQTATLQWRTTLPNQAQVWQPVSGEFAIHPEVDNPYDPAQADVVAEIQGPDGRQRRFPAFWFEPHTLELIDQRETVKPTANGRWALRYAFEQSGTWRWRIHAELSHHGQRLEVSSDWHDIHVTPTKDQALLPVSASDDGRYWQTSDGAWFYPLGITIRSPGDRRQNVLLGDRPERHSDDWEALGTKAYQHWFQQLAAHGGNFARVWMSPWWGALEWHKDWDGYQGLGRYHQGNAARIDRLIDDARSNGIYLQLELLNHGMTSEHVDEQWHPDPKRDELGSPYNQLNGGPLVNAHEFYSDDKAWALHERRLRYTVARWGYASNVMAWVLSSEMEFTGAYYQEAFHARPGQDHSPTLEAWIKRNLEWFQHHDHHQRPVSVHFSHPWRAQSIWRIPGLGFSYSNAYTGFQELGQLGHPRSGLGGALLTYLRSHFPPDQLRRPTMIGEWGGHWQERDPDLLAAEWRTGLWMQAVLPYAGNTGFWWWLWVDANDAWHHMGAVRQFLQGEDPRGIDWQPMVPFLERGDTRAQALGSRSADRMLIYAYLRGYDRGPLENETARDQDAGTLILEAGEAVQTWQWQRFETSRGELVESGTVISNDEGKLLLPLGSLDGDAAFKLKRVTYNTSGESGENQ